MFGRKSKEHEFLEAIELLVLKSADSTPKTLHAGAKRILDRSSGFSGNGLEELISHIVNPPTRAKSKAAPKSKLRGPSSDLTEEAVSRLTDAEDDRARFDEVVKLYSTSCSAPALKQIAAAYAASSTPKTKSAAIELIMSELANKSRARKKRQISSESTPW